jgi:Zn-dependent alcohol dehydrogenase
VAIGVSFPEAYFSYDASDLVWRRLSLTGIHNYATKHLQKAIDFLVAARQRFDFESIVTHRFNLEQINTAMKTAASGEAIRVAIVP